MYPNLENIESIPPSHQLPPASIPKKSWKEQLIYWSRKIVLCGLIAIGAYLGLCTLLLLSLNFLNPPITAVQIQRATEAFLTGEQYHRRAIYRPLNTISDNLEHAVIAGEDTRFYQHWGVDFKELRKMLKSVEHGKGRLRGASTITQQLVKNLFLFTYRSYFRKVLEYPLTFLAELILSKHRILELYLNVVEWGRGVYGAQAAAEFYYGVSARSLTRDQSARLAAILPDPRHRRPSAMDNYSRIILHRMDSFGW